MDTYTIEVIDGERIVLMVDVTEATRAAVSDTLFALFAAKAKRAGQQFQFCIRVRGR
jgi:hypothetical protein